MPTDGFYDIESMHDAFTFSHYNPFNNIVNVFVYWGEDKLSLLSEDDIKIIKNKILEVNPELNSKDKPVTINVFNGITELVNFLAPLFAHQLKPSSQVHQILSRMRNPYTGKSLIENPFADEIGDNDTSIHTYQLGFNSRSYDMGILAYVMDQWLKGNLPMEDKDWEEDKYLLPSSVRNISDKVIHANYPGAIEELSFMSDAGKLLSAMTKSTRFADIRLMLGKSAKLTLGLKRYAAQAGWQILESELVKSNAGLHSIARAMKQENPNSKIEPIHLLADVIGYNVLDVLNSKKLFEMPDWQIGFSQHLQLLERFESSFEGQLYVDSTNSKFIEYVIVPYNGGKPIVLKDSEAIDLHFPTQDGVKDILEIAKEMGMPEEAYAFYDNYRGAKTTSTKQAVEIGKENVLKDPRLANALEELRLSEKGTTLDIWVQDPKGNPNNSHINLSVGGAHGEYANYNDFLKATAGLRKAEYVQKYVVAQYNNLKPELDEATTDPKEYAKALKKVRLEYTRYVNDDGVPLDEHNKPISDILIKSVVTVNSNRITLKRLPKVNKLPASYVETIVGKEIVHADVDSLYPTLLTLLQSLLRNDGVDVYGDLRNERLKLKHSLPKLKTDYTPQDIANNAIQLLNKLLLNSATGAADANFDTNILVSNKITSMRIIGNILIYILSMKLAEAGGTLVSINTDGLYVKGLTEEEADKVIIKWREYFNLSAEPEIVDKFISKDTNNRLEIVDDKVEYAGGGSFSAWQRPSMMKSVAKPAMMDETLVNYMWKNDMPLDDFNRQFVIDYINGRIANAKTNDEKASLLLQLQWIFTSSPSTNRYYYLHNLETNELKQMSNISRAFIVDESYSNYAIKLLSAAKGNASDNDIAHGLIVSDKIDIKFETGQHLATDDEKAVDKLINEIKDLKKKTTDVPAWYRQNQSRLDKAIDVMGVSRSDYAPLALIGDFKQFTTYFKEKYKETMTGKNSKILRSNFIASPRVAETMHFAVNNHSLSDIAETDILSHIDVEAYADLVSGEWSLWAENHINL